MQVINIGNLPVTSNSVPKTQSKQHVQNFASVDNNTFNANTFLSSAQREQDMVYTDLKELYKRQSNYNQVKKTDNDDYTTSDNYEKMTDNTTGATYYKPKDSSVGIKMTNEDFKKMYDSFGGDLSEFRVHQMTLAGKYKDYGDYTVIVTDSDASSGLFNDGILFKNNKDDSAMFYENLDTDMFMKELDNHISKNDLDFDSFKSLINQISNGMAILRFSA